MDNEIKDLLISQCKIRIFDENYKRIFSCLDMISEDQLWWRPNEESNSIGNLILHLAGNCRQWIVSGLGDKEDKRQRAREFSSRESASRQQLREELYSLKSELEAVLDVILADDLVSTRKVQIYEESGVSILVHVVEHFSYHTGQIAYITKMLLGKPLSFYDDTVLN